MDLFPIISHFNTLRISDFDQTVIKALCLALSIIKITPSKTSITAWGHMGWMYIRNDL
ncbi:hypothetical protein [Maribacter polysaccharolyticus]|uniref:hypothetical protein n=1 Tax=Maribacter polysaccharolyticus TaxID=3020831 RepID=UPI00237FAD70|nr:hypothetical protein [Maribacter polysaccharolyticus]MDE3741822.1 hypothetical protein [Maribacter polysaccharolyticus]